MFSNPTAGATPRQSSPDSPSESPLAAAAFGTIWFEGGQPRGELQQIRFEGRTSVYMTLSESRQYRSNQSRLLGQAFFGQLQHPEVLRSRREIFERQQQRKRERLAAHLNLPREEAAARPYGVTERLLVEGLARAAVPQAPAQAGSCRQTDDDDVVVRLSDSTEAGSAAPLAGDTVKGSGAVGGERPSETSGCKGTFLSKDPRVPVPGAAQSPSPTPPRQRSFFQKIGAGLAAIWNGCVEWLRRIGRLFKGS
jgi:hypothetical protein